MNEEIKFGGHISRQFDQELEEIRARVLKMGGFIESQLNKTLIALSEGDVSAVSVISAQDRKVNEMEMTIDDECTQMLAKRQPAAGDLRMIIATSKSVRDLERIGDEVGRVAIMIQHALEQDVSSDTFKGLLLLGEHVKNLLHKTLNTYARMDTRSAVKNIRLDQTVDEEYGMVMVRLVDLMKDNTDDIATSLDVMWAARSLERIGDHCVNICENVIYLVEGADVRHTAVDDIKEQLS